MSVGSIKKIQSLNAMPLNANNNVLSYDISNDNGLIDMVSSYLEMELTLPSLTSLQGVCLGQDGFFYNESSLLRNCRLSEMGSSKVLSEVNYCNIISNNLEYVAKGKNARDADALWSGSAHVQSNNQTVSIFNNTYPDANPVLRVPLSKCFLGSAGNSDMFPQQSDLNVRFLLENMYKCFMRAVPAGYYESGGSAFDGYFACANVALNVAVIVPSALGQIGKFTVGDEVYVSFTSNAVNQIVLRTITNVVPDAGLVIGNFTVNAVLDAANAATNVVTNRISGDNRPVDIDDLQAGGDTLTIHAPSTLPINKDIYVGTKVNVLYKTLAFNGVASAEIKLRTSVKALTVGGVGNGFIQTIQLDAPLVCPAGSIIVDIGLVPLFTNITADYSIVSAHLVLYRRIIPFVMPKSILVTAYDTQTVAMTQGLNKFQFNYQIPNNTYNVYLLTPSGTNMISTDQGVLGKYQYSQNGVNLTTIQIDSTGNSSTHLDNMIRTFDNSEIYKVRNLSKERDDMIELDVTPVLFPAKLFHSTVKGEPNVLPDGQKSIRVEVETHTGTTPSLNTYMVLEMYRQI
jgi:hypothetical protein